MDAKSFSTPFGFKFRGGIFDLHVLAIDGMSLLVFLVKTDLNWSTKMSDLLTPSFTRDPFFFSGGVPMLSWRFDFMYFQNGLVLLLSSPSCIIVLTLNAPITTKDVCFSRLLKCLRNLYGKNC